MKDFYYKPLRYRKRWFCYLDLLGFSALVNSSRIERVIPLYKEAASRLEELAATKKRLGIIYTWFSDTFIIYSRNDSEKDFAHLERFGRLFFQSLILNGIPARGAITHGALYSQVSANVFIGPALIDAYRYAESQDWIGFILTPNVQERLNGSSLDLSQRVHYRLLVEPNIVRCEPSSPIYAFAFNNATVNGKNPYLDSLIKMQEQAPGFAKEKYRRTISFAKQHWRSDELVSDVVSRAE